MKSIPIWKPGKKPPYMESTEKDALTGERIKNAVMCLNYQGLQLAAAGYMLMMTRLHITPAELCRLLEEV
ncbi:MAG: hypothetical protein IJR80_09195 [Treponema sp.]|nr:hypothetical protein [Treponema sp.]